jgi:hypothetical protein
MSTTVKQRGARYFGANNTRGMVHVPLGRSRCAFVGTDRLWIYEELPTRGMAVRLSPRMRDDLLAALERTAPLVNPENGEPDA